jgi:hypothetical protein
MVARTTTFDAIDDRGNGLVPSKRSSTVINFDPKPSNWLDPHEVEGAEKAERFAHNFRHSPHGILGTLARCFIVFEATNQLESSAWQHFVERIDMAAIPTRFKHMWAIGSHCLEWESSNLPTEWLALYLFATIGGEEYDLMIRDGRVARDADPSSILDGLVGWRRALRR